MMKQILKKISLLAIVLWTGSAVAAPCDGLNFTAQSALINLPDENDLPLAFTVTRTATSGTCNFFFVMTNDGASSYSTRILSAGGGNTIPIQFYKASGHVASNAIGSNTPSLSNVYSGSLSGTSTSVNMSYYAYVDTSISVPIGNYGGLFDLRLYSWNGSNLNSAQFITDKKNISFKYRVDTSISLSLVNTGSLYNAGDVDQTLDFGSLTSGESLGFDLWLVYSSGYRLSLTSTNAGNLKNTGVASSNLVPYTLSFDNVAVALNSTETFVKSAAAGVASPSGGTKVQVLATIGNIGTVYSGTYSDTVTFKIYAP
jgi:hypothetical protein